MNKTFKIGLICVLGLFSLIGMVFTAVFIGMQFGLFNVRGSILERNSFFTQKIGSQGAAVATSMSSQPCVSQSVRTCAWNETPQWLVVDGGLSKDVEIIKRVSAETGVSPRLIASVVVPEQIRFFTSEREVFKRYFEPLKILGSLSQFSLGVSGIKQETAKQIELYASDKTSPLYPGEAYANLLAYKPGINHDGELYRRLTDPKDHYYSYLYTAVYIKEIQMQWSRAGFPLDTKPEIIGTLFNIGFQGSRPNATPRVAGASITTGGTTYTFGELGGLFYNSKELPILK